MLTTKNITTYIEDIPNTWIFEYYLNLSEALTGQNIQMKSIFSTKDKNPSLFVYFDDHKYKFKDFSTGFQGDGIQLVKHLFDLDKRYEAGIKIFNDYAEYTKTHKNLDVRTINPVYKYKLKSYKIRKWIKSDGVFWLRFRINSKILKFFNVYPLDYFIVEKEDGSKEIKIQSTKIYGYFKKNGDLYKVYQPFMKDKKFFKVTDHIQGIEQLTYAKPYLVIGSSLKDIMSFTRLAFQNIEVIAPDSENVLLPETLILELLQKYPAICTLFDDDPAGIRSMLKYKELYNIPMAHFKLEKDIAEDLEHHGIPSIKELIYPVLTKALTGTSKELPI